MRRVEAVGSTSTTDTPWHVVTSFGFTCCGMAPENVRGTERMLARLVPVERRCKRGGCRRYWPPNLRAVS